MSIESKIISTYDLLELSRIISDIGNEISHFEKDKRYDINYEYYLRYSYLIKLKLEATKKINSIYNSKVKSKESHL